MESSISSAVAVSFVCSLLSHPFLRNKGRRFWGENADRTGTRSSEITCLKWDWIRGGDRHSGRIEVQAQFLMATIEEEAEVVVGGAHDGVALNAEASLEKVSIELALGLLRPITASMAREPLAVQFVDPRRSTWIGRYVIFQGLFQAEPDPSNRCHTASSMRPFPVGVSVLK